VKYDKKIDLQVNGRSYDISCSLLGCNRGQKGADETFEIITPKLIAEILKIQREQNEKKHRNRGIHR
jgi:hypothetical protein